MGWAKPAPVPMMCESQEKETRVGDYMRSTRECAFGQLRPELVQAIRDYLQKHELGTIEADISICCETMSEKKRRDFCAPY